MARDLKEIADDIGIELAVRLPEHRIARQRSDHSLLNSTAIGATIMIFEEYEETELVGLHVVTKLLGSFDASRMLHARVIQILATEGVEMIEETLSVQVMGEAFGL